MTVDPLMFSIPTALEYFATLVADDASLSLVEAAASVAQDDTPDLDVGAVLAEVDAMAARLRARLPSDAAGLQRLRLLNRYFFDELGFAGNVNDYYDTRNSYLHAVLETRRGIPISLAVIYIEIAGQIGLEAHGVSFPGHFLVKVRLDRRQTDVVIDPFTGHSLSREELSERLAPYKANRGLVGDFDAPLGLFLQSAQPRDVLARMLRNLKEVHRARQDWTRVLAVQRRLVVLLPQAFEELRDRGMAQMQLGHVDAAVEDLSAYLRHSPDADDRREVRERIRQLKSDGRPPLH